MAEVRQSAFALVGDLTISCFSLLHPFLAQLMPMMIQHLNTNVDPSQISACNNACWALGEISLRLGQAELAPFVPALTERLVHMMQIKEIPRTLLENVAITLGRLGGVCPDQVAPHLASFSEPWFVIHFDIFFI